MKRFRHIYSDAKTGFLSVGREMKMAKRRRERDISAVREKSVAARRKVGGAVGRMPFAGMESFGRSFVEATDEVFGIDPKPTRKGKTREPSRRKRQRDRAVFDDFFS